MGRVVALVLVLGFTFIGCSHEEENKEKWAELQRERDAETIRLQQQIFAQKVEWVRTVFGELDAKTFELCNTVPPQTKAHQKQCAALEAKIEKAHAKQEKW
jgi:hypothetical protein